MFTSTFVALYLAAVASATVFITEPTASTTCSGGQVCNIKWQDSGAAPTLAQFGAAKVFVGIGNSQQQTMIQTVAPTVDVSTTSAIQFTVDPKAGGNSNKYFIRVESIAAKDPANPTFPLLSFSAQFTMNSMTGTFNASVQSQIDGLSTAPLGGGATSTSAGGASTTPASTTAAKTTASSGSSSAANATGAKPTTTGAAGANGAGHVAISTAAGLLGFALALFAMAF